ncbi:glycerol-3-phosphate responsive antiterminator [Sporolactobacillus kofuensis]|uniref:Glycerol uptake operon antiterminator regulatory protein n=1 Tax=Sporolactobacillus kofuensis TaxID=269672 RepID=A0ABW1WD23_9BACL|nr:glycerol-3-phosphate responsive antiterminator [Sporolactobacillus kofuensis]MCO7174778.1 glycerol-3-phosphate responsive antiterminator [Sporolactobacillus kofuensis]
MEEGIDIILSAINGIIPAVNNMKDYEKLLMSPVQSIIVLDSHISQIGAITKLAKQNQKNVFLHTDFIQGLKNDLYATEFICQNIRPFGIISTRANVLELAKKRGLITVLRIFLLDSRSLDTGYRLLQQVQPNYVELLPGLIPKMIKEVRERAAVPVIAGGLIRTEQEIKDALAAGASAVSTSNRQLWKFIQSTQL